MEGTPTKKEVRGRDGGNSQDIQGMHVVVNMCEVSVQSGTGELRHSSQCWSVVLVTPETIKV